jgi:hypothetical protein
LIDLICIGNVYLYLTVELDTCSWEEAVVMLFVPLACINPVFADRQKMKAVRHHSLLNL